MKNWIGKGFASAVKGFVSLVLFGITLACVDANAASSNPRQDPPPGNSQQLTARQAVRILQETLPKITVYSTGWGARKSQGGTLTSTGFSVTSPGDVHEFEFSSFDHYISASNQWIIFGVPKAKYVVLGWDKKVNGIEDAERTVNALNRLIYDTQHGTNLSEIESPVDDWSSFQKAASDWRVLTVKPELPEEARKQRVLAESYLREKDFNGAIQHYELGVKACSTWPEGWFNLALLYGETGEFALAADRMKHYLELMPNSPDAPAARDKIVIWEDKASQPRSQQ
jgi:tetratricopeptide (TPR) repeat protein